MKNLYRFNEFLSESDTIGDFAKKFTDRMDNVKKVADEAKEKAEKEKEDPTFEFKDKPLEKSDSRKEWVKKIQDVFVHKKLQDKIDSKNYGSFGGNTETAVKKYQKEKGKEETGKVNNELMKLILKDWEDLKKENENEIPFKTKKEGDAFRTWVIAKDGDYAEEINLAETGEYNNDNIKKAWEKYGKDYIKFKERK
jgi:peptidoglycan hydrolase-like protein with peptidoglycan-binding domain